MVPRAGDLEVVLLVYHRVQSVLSKLEGTRSREEHGGDDRSSSRSFTDEEGTALRGHHISHHARACAVCFCSCENCVRFASHVRFFPFVLLLLLLLVPREWS